MYRVLHFFQLFALYVRVNSLHAFVKVEIISKILKLYGNIYNKVQFVNMI